MRLAVMTCLGIGKVVLGNLIPDGGDKGMGDGIHHPPTHIKGRLNKTPCYREYLNNRLPPLFGLVKYGFIEIYVPSAPLLPGIDVL